MNATKLGAKIRLARVRLGLRQLDVARRARVSRSTVSRIERGQLTRVSIGRVERVADAVGGWIDADFRTRGGEVDRLVNAGHAALAEDVLAWICSQPGWRAKAEVSFAIAREAGVIDILACHTATAHVVVIELKTTIYDIHEHLGTLDRKRRLARIIAQEQGWQTKHTSVWLIVAESKTNRRRLAAHRTLVASQLPAEGRSLRAWFRDPASPLAGVAFWTCAHLGSIRPSVTARERVRVPTPHPRERDHSSPGSVGAEFLPSRPLHEH